MAFEKTSNCGVSPICQSLQIDQLSPEGTQGGAFCPSLLVYNYTKRAVSSVHDYKIWGPKQRRAYQRINSGFKIAEFTHSRVRFVSLTTSNEGREHDLKRDVEILVKRVRRRYKGVRFEYFRVRTDEGNGVVHLLYRGPFIARTWLKAQWEDIHASWNVDIRESQRYHKAYVVNQYLCNQEASYTRYSRSWWWIPPGALKVWAGFCKWYPKLTAQGLWVEYLHQRVIAKQQQVLPIEEEPPPRFVETALEVPREEKPTLLPGFDTTAFLDGLYGANVRHCLFCHQMKKGGYWAVSGGFVCYDCYSKEDRANCSG